MDKYLLIFLSLILVFSLYSKLAQSQDELGMLISESVEDTESAIKAYGGPFLKAIGTDLNTGYASSGEPLEWGDLNLKLVGTASFAPEDDLSFRPAEYGLDEQSSGIYTEEEILPTIFGDETTASIQARATSQNGEQIRTTTTIPLLTLGVRGAPMLMPQADIGFFGGTQIMIRGLPPVKVPTYNQLRSLETSYFGMGVLHDIKQYIPDFQSSGFSWSVYLTRSTASLSLGGPFYTDDDVREYANEDVQEPEEEKDYNNQKMNFDSKGFSFGTIISNKFKVVTLFGGLEYVSTSTNLNLEGDYPYVNYSGQIAHITDLLDITEKTGRMGFNAGLKADVSFLNISLSASLVNGGYSTVGASVGFQLLD